MSIIHGAATGRFDDDHEPPRSNRERIRISRRRAQYNLEPEEYEQMVEDQEGRCAICDRPEVLVIDHDHATGKVRALLCRACNVGLGFIRDDPDTARRMAEYLESHA